MLQQQQEQEEGKLVWGCIAVLHGMHTPGTPHQCPGCMIMPLATAIGSSQARLNRMRPVLMRSWAFIQH